MTRQFTLIPRFVSRSQMDIVRWYNFQMSESEYLLRWLGPGAAVNCGWWIILLSSVCSASICIHNPSWPKLCCPNLLVTASKGDNFIFSVTVQTASKLIVVILATSSTCNFPRTLPIVLRLDIQDYAHCNFNLKCVKVGSLLSNLRGSGLCS